MRTIRNNVLLAAVLLIASAVSAFAQMVCNTNPEGCTNPVNPPGSCWPAAAPLLRGVNSRISGGILPGLFTLNTQCPATFNIVTPGPVGCCPRAFQPACPGCWTCPGSDPILGGFTWTILCPNICPVSTQTPVCIPVGGTAIVDIYFNVGGTIAMFPGMIFHSTQCIHLQGTVTSCGQFQCEVFTLVNGPIAFNDQFGVFAFNLDCLAMVLNG